MEVSLGPASINSDSEIPEIYETETDLRPECEQYFPIPLVLQTIFPVNVFKFLCTKIYSKVV